MQYDIMLHKYQDMIEDVLKRVENVLNQGVDTKSGDLDLLSQDLENETINGGYSTKIVEYILTVAPLEIKIVFFSG